MRQITNLTDLQRGGLVVGQTKDGHRLYYIPEDTHSLIIGATRSGKTRCLVLPSIGLTAMAGESMVLVDMKGELYTYSRYFLESLGYEVIAIDFMNPQYSNCYNFLQPVIDALNQGQTARAVTLARDAATMMIPDNHANEAIWVDGARAVLTLAILAVTNDNQENPQYQNLANVQQFITYMCQPVGAYGQLPLNLYLSLLDEDHPAKLAMGISQIAPSKMRGSFFTSALSALAMFTDPMIHSMTASTDFDTELTGMRKRAIFLILPDYKKTYHSNLTLCWEIMSRDRNEPVLLIADEGHILFDPEIPQTSMYMRNFGKRGRKYEAALWLVTHSLVDLLNDKVKLYGQAILDGAEYKIFFGTDGKNLEETANLYHLTEAEKSILLSRQRGKALFLLGKQHLHVDFDIPPYKLELMGKGGGR